MPLQPPPQSRDGGQYEQRTGKERQRARPILPQVIVAQIKRERRQIVRNPNEIEGRQNEQSALPGWKPPIAEYQHQPCERRQQKAAAVECSRLNPNIAGAAQRRIPAAFFLASAAAAPRISSGRKPASRRVSVLTS